MRLLLILRLLLFIIGLKLTRGYYYRGGYYPSAVTITGNTVLGWRFNQEWPPICADTVVLKTSETILKYIWIFKSSFNTFEI